MAANWVWMCEFWETELDAGLQSLGRREASHPILIQFHSNFTHFSPVFAFFWFFMFFLWSVLKLQLLPFCCAVCEVCDVGVRHFIICCCLFVSLLHFYNFYAGILKLLFVFSHFYLLFSCFSMACFKIVCLNVILLCFSCTFTRYVKHLELPHCWTCWTFRKLRFSTR